MTSAKTGATPLSGAPRILIVDDEAPIRRFLKIALGSGGFEVVEADSVREGLERAATTKPDAILLDLGLPDGDGKSVISAVREWSNAPIIVLTVRDSESEKIAALDAGADDYVTKPFGTGELLARLRAALRKRGDRAALGAIFDVGKLHFDLAERNIHLDGTEVKLTRKQFDVLAYLARHAGRLVTQRQLLEAIWGPSHTNDAHYLRVAIGQIRDKLSDDAANPRFILTEPGVGYRMRGD
jgi:DNA-binding response OmpR family regulator